MHLEFIPITLFRFVENRLKNASNQVQSAQLSSTFLHGETKPQCRSSGAHCPVKRRRDYGPPCKDSCSLAIPMPRKPITRAHCSTVVNNVAGPKVKDGSPKITQRIYIEVAMI